MPDPSAVSDDAFFHPGADLRMLLPPPRVGRDGYEPEPTYCVRIRKRRGSFSRVVVAAMAVLGVIALAGVLVPWLRDAGDLSARSARSALVLGGTASRDVTSRAPERMRPAQHRAPASRRPKGR